MDINELRRLAGLPPLEGVVESRVSELEEEFDTGYTEREHDADDYFPNGADGPVSDSAGPASAKSGDNPLQKSIKEASSSRRVHVSGDVESGDYSVVYFNREWDEYVVKFYENGKYNPEADYHTSDKRDAIDTADMARSVDVSDDDYDYIMTNSKKYEMEPDDTNLHYEVDPDRKDLYDDARTAYADPHLVRGNKHPLDGEYDIGIDPALYGDSELSHNYFDEYPEHDALEQDGLVAFDDNDPQYAEYGSSNPEDHVDDYRDLLDVTDGRDEQDIDGAMGDYRSRKMMRDMDESRDIHESLVRQYRKFLKE